MVDTASQGFAPLVAMETPLGSTTALILAFLCITPRQTVPPCAGTGPCQPRAWADTRMCGLFFVVVFFFLCDGEPEEGRDGNTVGGIGRRDKRERTE